MHVLNGQWLCCVVIRSPCKLMQGKCDININGGVHVPAGVQNTARRQAELT